MKTNREKEVVRKIVREILLQENFSRSALVEDKTDSSPSDASDPLSYLSAPDEKFYVDILKATEPIGFTSADPGGPYLPPGSGSMEGYARHPIRVYGPDRKSVISSPIDGVEMYQDVHFEPIITEFVRKMRANLDKSVPMTITSGARTPPEQAAAMFQKHLSAGGGGHGGQGYKEIMNVYNKEMADLLYSVKPTEQNWLALLEKRVKEGGRKLPHERGEGVDIRTRGLSSEQVSALIVAARRAGGETLLEKHPAHLHITIK